VELRSRHENQLPRQDPSHGHGREVDHPVLGAAYQIHDPTESTVDRMDGIADYFAHAAQR
jgi:hypothetical protein